MDRTLLLVMCLQAGFFVSGQFSLARAEDLSQVFQDFGNADESAVRAEAVRQTSDGTKYNSVKAGELKYFWGLFTAGASTTKLAVFSDDGCTVKIDGTAILTRRGVGQHLPDLTQSFHIINFAFVEGVTYEIMVEYTNTIHPGDWDVDGVTLFAFNGGGSITDSFSLLVEDKSNWQNRVDASKRPEGPVLELVDTSDGSASFILKPTFTPNSLRARRACIWQVEGNSVQAPSSGRFDDPYNDGPTVKVFPNSDANRLFRVTAGIDRNNNGQLEPAEVLAFARVNVAKKEALVDLDVDSNNDGLIAPINTETEDEYESILPGKIMPAMKKGALRVLTTATQGTITLSTTMAPEVLSFSCGGLPKTWNLASQKVPPIDMYVFGLNNSDDRSILSRTGTITATFQDQDGNLTTDEVVVTAVPEVSRSPQNNRGASWEADGAFGSVCPNIESLTTGLGYSFDKRRFRDKSQFGGQFTNGFHTDVTWAEYTKLGKVGLLATSGHGGFVDFDEDGTKDECALEVIWRPTRDEVLAFLGPGTTEAPPGTRILPFTPPLQNEPGYLLVITSSWVEANWKSDRDNARSFGFFMHCFSASSIGGKPSVVDAAGGMEAFGYQGTCSTPTHLQNTTLLLSRMNGSIDGAAFRVAGIAYEQGGFVTMPPASGELRHSTNGSYWATLCPAPYVTARVSTTSITGKKIGWVGVSLDTQRDTSITPDVVITGAGICNGPYNMSPSWGIGAEFCLNPGQPLSFHFDNKSVVGDGSTMLLYCDVDRVTPNQDGIEWGN